MTVLVHQAEDVEDMVTNCWMENLEEAYMLARGERQAELKADRPRLLDATGLHPYSRAWGAIYTCESLQPVLRAVRGPLAGGHPCDPVSLRKIARADAMDDFVRSLGQAE